jgi:hypothetical protein
MKGEEMSKPGRRIYFVGSIPLEHEVDVFNALTEIGGDRLARVPDGELGDRKMWVIGQYPVLASAKALELGAYPKEGLTRRTSYQVPVRLRQGAKDTDIVFDHLGYWRRAVSSYALFSRMKKSEKIPSHWRLQVNLPTPSDVMSMVEPATRPAAEEAYKRALLRELKDIERDIPRDELSITWDVVQSVLIWEDPTNKYVTQYFGDPKQGYLTRLIELGKSVSPDVELGYHLCYGSQDHKHAVEPKDLSACVNLTNALAAGVGRKINYVHMPVPRERGDDAYFVPLKTLNRSKIGEVYLGLVHFTDGVAGACKRIATAERYLADFGIATECGFGRRPTHQDVHTLIKLHGEITC